MVALRSLLATCGQNETENSQNSQIDTGARVKIVSSNLAVETGTPGCSFDREFSWPPIGRRV